MSDYRDDVQDAMREWYAAQARREEAVAKLNELTFRQSELNEKFNGAGDLRNHTYRLTGVIDYDSVGYTVEHFARWARMDAGCDLHLVINSNGGSIFAGMELYDEIMSLRDNGHKVTVTVRGWAASMASIVLQAADDRVMGARSYLVLHQPSGGAVGSLGEIEDAEEMLSLMNKNTLDIYAARCADSGAVKPFTREQLRRKYNRKDWTVGATEALEGGLVDRIG